MEILQPGGWDPPKGYSNGVSVEGPGRTIYVAGQIAWNANQKIVGAGDFAAQFEQALSNVVAVVASGGGGPEHIVRLTMYVLSTEAYMDSIKAVGASYREIIGRNFPAMALVQVAGLLESQALIEIEATAFVPA
ncbi:MAG: enamine deaminase RidA (YjgF/YER057c/UK114 family) [Planctomycetota bacterium]|jgi:enamine deaminase RidA (YjgF/YER057c/UK114 family)